MSHELDPLKKMMDAWGGQSERSFAISYGSSVSGSPTSDFDMLIVSESMPSQQQREKLINELMEQHKQAGREIDFEVPHDNKIFYTYDELDEVIRLPFMTPEQPGLIEVRYLDQASDDDPYFLSLEMRQRLLFNALTSPHEFLTGEIRNYSTAERIAQEGLRRIISHLQAKDNRSIEEILAISPDGIEGKDYLGYFVRKPNAHSLEVEE